MVFAGHREGTCAFVSSRKLVIYPIIVPTCPKMVLPLARNKGDLKECIETSFEQSYQIDFPISLIPIHMKESLIDSSGTNLLRSRRCIKFLFKKWHTSHSDSIPVYRVYSVTPRCPIIISQLFENRIITGEEQRRPKRVEGGKERELTGRFCLFAHYRGGEEFKHRPGPISNFPHGRLET